MLRLFLVFMMITMTAQAEMRQPIQGYHEYKEPAPLPEFIQREADALQGRIMGGFNQFQTPAGEYSKPRPQEASNLMETTATVRILE